ncbi:hypothetical protein DNTS_011890 [Danionella cerebrum]|uniref:Uncharacterized protein n=1 Tax=Danionella cerebrum TaxID=2873325 RepID=A0A553Q7F3_9TELE|nr:hypothetical protein DNTS_011890 [Danionella translucida]
MSCGSGKSRDETLIEMNRTAWSGGEDNNGYHSSADKETLQLEAAEDQTPPESILRTKAMIGTVLRSHRIMEGFFGGAWSCWCTTVNKSVKEK